MVVGLGGLPGDIATLGRWIPAVTGNAGRWALVILALVLLVITEGLIPRMLGWLRSRFASADSETQDVTPPAKRRVSPSVVPEMPHDMMALKCVRQDSPYNSGEIAGFTYSEAIARLESGAWVPLFKDLRNAVELFLIEFRMFKTAYEMGITQETALEDGEDIENTIKEDRIKEARANLRAALECYLSISQSFPVATERQFHLQVYRGLAEALEIEEERYPVGLVAFAGQLTALEAWKDARDLQDRKQELRHLLALG